MPRPMKVKMSMDPDSSIIEEQINAWLEWCHCRCNNYSLAGRFALIREIPICAGLRGGAGRTRTSNQTIISR